MKRIIIICTVLLSSLGLLAQAPSKMSYQAVIRNNSNILITSSAVGMRISIIQGSIFGASVYVETQTSTTNANGLVTLEIGSGTVVLGTFSLINWANGPYFIKTETDPAGGTSYAITGISQLLSVPYALYAETSGSSQQGPQGLPGPTGPQGPTGAGCFTHFIGEQFGGGVIFHIWKDAQEIEHGLIVDLNDLSNSQIYSNVDQILIGPSAESTWDGLSNSNAIVNQAGHTSSAAALCLNSTNGGQNDWYLPSIDELSLLWQNRFNVNKTISTISAASILPYAYYGWYWSSTEDTENSDYAFHLGFMSGDEMSIPKQDGKFIRAVRNF